MTITTTQTVPVIQRARSAETTPDQLATLLHNSNPVVAISIAQRPDLDTQLAETLACDTRAAVRLRVAKNTAAPVHVLEKLQEDVSAQVRSAATDTLVMKTMRRES